MQKTITEAYSRIKTHIRKTPLEHSLLLSQLTGANVYLKLENWQLTGSFKLRGAMNKILSVSDFDRNHKTFVAASTGNHAAAFAYAVKKMGLKGEIFLPKIVSSTKLEFIESFGVPCQLYGEDSLETEIYTREYAEKNSCILVHPYNDETIIAGQGTIGLEILNQTDSEIDYLILPVGGGGLSAGVSAVFKTLSPKTKIIGVEPAGAPSMKKSIEQGELVTLKEIEKFVDGAAVKRVGELNFEICKDTLHQMMIVEEGRICQCILDLYNKDAIVVEPAGALTIAVLDQLADEIKGKNVVCLVSGSNNDITRTEEIKERALLHRGLKHYFVIRFPQRAGALKEFVSEILGSEDDITYFQYSKKHNRENGPAVVGIELKNSEDLQPLMNRLKSRNFFGEYLNDKADLMDLLI